MPLTCSDVCRFRFIPTHVDRLLPGRIGSHRGLNRFANAGWNVIVSKRVYTMRAVAGAVSKRAYALLGSRGVVSKRVYIIVRVARRR